MFSSQTSHSRRPLILLRFKNFEGVSLEPPFVNGPVSFFILRFLLGLAEAGFFPGMILYFTYWFPPYHRARIIAGFMAAIPVAIGLGAPVSTALLELDGFFGLAG